MRSRQSGFTLFELAIVLAVLSILATLAVPNFMDQYNEKRAAVTIKETDLMLDAARAYRSDTGNWPGHPTCETALAVLRGGTEPYLGGTNSTNRYNSAYVTACNANSFSILQSIIPDFDGVVANGLAGTVVSNSATNTITSIVGVPGSEGAIAGKLSRIATGNLDDNRMRTALLLGGNNISEVNNVSSASITNSGALNTGSLATGNLTAGNMSAASLATTGNIVTRGQLQAHNGAAIFGNSTIDGQILARELGLQGTATEGGACTRRGNISTTTAGMSMSCQGGRWTRSSNWINSRVTAGSNCLSSAGKGSFAVGTDGKLYVCR